MDRTTYLAIGITLAILGAGALIWQGISYTQRDTLVNVGGVKVTADTRKTLPLSPILGGIALAGGIGAIAVGARKA